MNKIINTTTELKSIVDYIIWNYDENVDKIADKCPEAIVEETNNTYIVTITYVAGIEKGRVKSSDPQINDEDEQVIDQAKFTLLKTEKFRQLTKYVEDICAEIAKIEIEY